MLESPPHRTSMSPSGQRRSMTRWFDDIGQNDVAEVGGKNASLGEMIQRLKSSSPPIRVPDGFATTAQAYREFIMANELDDPIQEQLSKLGDDDRALEKVGQSIRQMIRKGKWPDEVAQSIRDAYHNLSKRYRKRNVDVAVRSSATAEDLPEASFAGQLESFLNVRGETQLLDACRKCFASLFTNRAISYRQQKGFDHLKVAVSVGVQKMVRSDKAPPGGAGVAFTLDTETGFPDIVLINAGWGLGESIVKGMIEPDEYRVFKPLLDQQSIEPILSKHLGTKQSKIIYGRSRRQGAQHRRSGTSGETTKIQKTPLRQQRTFVLSDDEILMLARWCAEIERHYHKPMDIEWAKDGQTGELYIVQARPETVESRRAPSVLKTYQLKQKSEPLLEGQAIGRAIASGPAFVIKSMRESHKFQEGGILVASMTDPDWVPLMKRAAGIVTDHGGRTSHAAIVSRELGVPAVVGTGEATSRLKSGHPAEITISCAEGETGYVYAGALEYEEREEKIEDLPRTRTKIMINLASPEGAFRWWSLRADGVGLARIEFIINNVIQIHPLALLRFDEVKESKVRQEIQGLIAKAGYQDKAEYFIDHLARGMATIAAAQYPNPVIVRFSDFKSNEYANLIGGSQFESHESNPMLGLRGASRYYSKLYREGFALECAAMKRAREEIGLRNIIAMIPFCRTPEEADRVLEAMAEHGLEREGGEDGLKVFVMAEIPSNIILAEEFASEGRFDGFSIGSNDLTQLVLGVDRDSEALAELFEERHEAVKRAICDLIDVAHEHEPSVPVGICGQAPSDHPEFADFLVECGIDSISVNPDSFIKVRKQVAAAERKGAKRQPLPAHA